MRKPGKIQRSQEIQCNFKEAYLLIKMTINKGGRVESLPKNREFHLTVHNGGDDGDVDNASDD